MDLATIKGLLKKNFKEVTNAELINAYQFIKGGRPQGSCSSCVRRMMWREIIKYVKAN